MLHKREYEILNAGITQTEVGTKTLQVSVKVTDYLGIRHGEHGEEIPRTKERTIGVAILVSELPTEKKKEYVMNRVKAAYKELLEAESQEYTLSRELVGYKAAEQVSR